MPEVKNSFDSLKQAAVDAIIAEVNGVIEGANADIVNFANAIVQDSLLAAAEGRTDLLAALQDQAGVIAEANRIRVAAGAERVVADVIRIALSVATRLVIPTIPTV